MASSFENYPLYPYPSEFNVRDFVPDKLSESNYKEWKKLMLDFIESRGLVGFIDGTVRAPPSAPLEMVTIPLPNDGGGGASSSSSHCQIIENEEMYRSWKRSYGLVWGWILTMLTKDIQTQVLPLKTTKEVWTKLETIFHYDEEIEEFILGCQPLHIAAITGDWKSAMKFIKESPDAARLPITRLSETALFIAIRMIRRNHFVKKLLEKMEPKDLAYRDVEATKLLVEKNPKLSNVGGFHGKIALNYAAARGNRKVVLYLLDATKQHQQLPPFEDKSSAELLCELCGSGLYGK